MIEVEGGLRVAGEGESATRRLVDLVNGILEHVDRTVQGRALLRRGQRVLIAVSGGLDSMVLLDVLHRLSERYHWKLTVAHFNHQLRGASSEADERLVVRTAGRHKLAVRVGRADVRAYGRAGKLSLEMAARRLRHQFLARVASRQHARVVALAHHADDQLELFFLRFLRGSGSQGLAGMRSRGPSPANADIELIRPLLDLPKSALRAYACEHRIVYHEDASNKSLDILRNRVRHRLLPSLRREHQGLDKTVVRTLEILRAEAELMEEMASEWLRHARKDVKKKAGRIPGRLRAESTDGVAHERRPVAYARAPFRRLPLALQRRVIQMQLMEIRIPTDFGLVEKLRLQPGRAVAAVAVENQEEHGLTVPGVQRQPGEEHRRLELAVVRDASGLVRLHGLERLAFQQGQQSLNLSRQEGELIFDGLGIRWQHANRKGASIRKPRPKSEYFDAQRVGKKVVLRHWRPGDRFQPIGMKSAAKLQDLFTNLKIPRDRRRELVVAVSARGQLFWVEGLRIGEGFKLRGTTKRRLRWSWQRL
jgi:tRNA(Ile)-lysidine synthase